LAGESPGENDSRFFFGLSMLNRFGFADFPSPFGVLGEVNIERRLPFLELILFWILPFGFPR
jgi:hypothetical protein